MIRAASLVLALLLVVNRADATILATCSELAGNGCSSSVFGITTGSTFYDSTYSRSAMGVTSGGATTTYPAPQGVYLTIPASTAFWSTGRVYIAAWSAVAGGIFMEFLDSGTVRLVLRKTTVSGELTLSKRDNAGTLTDLVTFSSGLCCSALHKVDVYINYGTEVTVYVDGSQVGQYLGDPRTNSATTLSRADFVGPLSSGSAFWWSETFVADEDARNFRMWTTAPNTAGADQTWPYAVASNINEAVPDDVTYNSTNASAARSNWTHGTVPTTYFIVKDVVTCSRVQRHATELGGPQNYRESVYVAGNNYDATADTAAALTFTDVCYDWGANSPASGTAWTKGIISTLQTGVISKP